MRRRVKHLYKGVEYRSKFEVQMAKRLEELGIPFTYESSKLKYIVPEVTRTYTPDFQLIDLGKYDYIETKGRFTAADRKKMLLVKLHNPAVKILMVFQNPNVTLSKISKTTYAEWCDKHDIEWTTIADFKKPRKKRRCK